MIPTMTPSSAPLAAREAAAGWLQSHLQGMSVALASQEAPEEHPKYEGQPSSGTEGCMLRIKWESNMSVYLPTPAFSPNRFTARMWRQDSPYSASRAALVAGSGMRSGPKNPSTMGKSWCDCKVIDVAVLITRGLPGTMVCTPKSKKLQPFGCTGGSPFSFLIFAAARTASRPTPFVERIACRWQLLQKSKVVKNKVGRVGKINETFSHQKLRLVEGRGPPWGTHRVS